MDHLRTRLDALEQQTTTLAHHARRVTRQLRWWRGLAVGSWSWDWGVGHSP
jgi:hypothetical protein